MKRRDKAAAKKTRARRLEQKMRGGPTGGGGGADKEEVDNIFDSQVIVLDTRGLETPISFVEQDSIHDVKVRLQEAGVGKVNDLHLLHIEDESKADDPRAFAAALPDEQPVFMLAHHSRQTVLRVATK
eukprot:924063-Prymnesium_polylepis.1